MYLSPCLSKARSLPLFVIGLLWAMLLAPVAHAAALTQGQVVVDDSGDGTGSGVCTLRDAVHLINGSGATGSCTASGTAMPPQIIFNLVTPATIQLADEILPSTNMAILGPGRDALTISGGRGNATPSRVFYVTTASLTVENLTIANGESPSGESGGGIRTCCGAGLTLAHVTVRDSKSDFAGGGIASGGPLNLSDTVISGNTAAQSSGTFLTFGGGLYVEVGSATLERVRISGNTVGSPSGEPGVGGGVFVRSPATANFTDSTIEGNFAPSTTFSTNYNPYPAGLGGQGAGLFSAGTSTLMRCTVDFNQSHFQGAGIFNLGTLKIFNSTIASNQTVNGGTFSLGGGIFNGSANGFGYGVNLQLVNSTLYGNSASASGGGGLYNEHADANAVVLANTAFGHQGAGQVGGDIVSTSSSPPDASSTFVEGSSAAGLVNGSNGNIVQQDAGFDALGHWGGVTQTVRILPTSPLRDSGSNALAVDAGLTPLAHDQRNATSIPRIYGGVVDIGAFEFANDLLFRDGFDGSP